jgi:hypothetical protein
MGILIAVKNAIDEYVKSQQVVTDDKVIERVRVNFDS